MIKRTGFEGGTSRESGAEIDIEPYDDGRHSAQRIAQMHLALRRWQEREGENVWRDIYDSQQDLRSIDSTYLAGGGQFLIAENQSGAIVGFVGLKRTGERAGVLKRLAAAYGRPYDKALLRASQPRNRFRVGRATANAATTGNRVLSLREPIIYKTPPICRVSGLSMNNAPRSRNGRLSATN